jgi:hypothetical protein
MEIAGMLEGVLLRAGGLSVNDAETLRAVIDELLADTTYVLGWPQQTPHRLSRG